MAAGFVGRQGAKAGSIGYEEEIAPTLRAGIDANVMCPEQKVFSFDSLSSNSMKSKNPKSGCREVDVAKTLDTSHPDPSKNQGGVAVLCAATQQGGAEILEDKCPTITASAGMSGNNQPYVCTNENKETNTGCYLFENHSQDTRYKGPLEVAQPVTATYGMGGNNQPFVVENHPTDSHVNLDERGTIQTLTSRMGTGGGNVPLVMNERQYALTVGEDLANTLTGTDYKGAQCVFEPTPKTMKIRAGCDGGGKSSTTEI